MNTEPDSESTDDGTDEGGDAEITRNMFDNSNEYHTDCTPFPSLLEYQAIDQNLEIKPDQLLILEVRYHFSNFMLWESQISNYNCPILTVSYSWYLDLKCNMLRKPQVKKNDSQPKNASILEVPLPNATAVNHDSLIVQTKLKYYSCSRFIYFSFTWPK